MKKELLKIGISIIFTLFILSTKAQNSLDFQWGVFTPVNSNFNKAFSNSNAFSIGLLHPMNNSAFSVGIAFSHEDYQSKDEYFKSGYNSELRIHNYLIVTRYDFIQHGDFKVYTSLNAGLNKTQNEATQNGNTVELRNNGFTTFIALGGEVRISRRFLMGANIKSQYNYTNDIQFDDKVTLNHLSSIAGNISVRFLLGTKK